MSAKDWLLVIIVIAVFLAVGALGVRDAIRALSTLRQVGAITVAVIAYLLAIAFFLSITPSAEIIDNQLRVRSLTGVRIIPSESIKEISLRYDADERSKTTLTVRRVKRLQSGLLVWLPADVAQDFAQQLSAATGAPIVVKGEPHNSSAS